MKNYYRVAITTGDTDGIGPEVTAKALNRLKPQRGVQLYLWRSQQFPKKYLRLIDRHFRRLTVKNWAEALKQDTDFYRTLIDIESVLPPAKWVEQSAKAGMAGGLDALVTAPLSKTGIIHAGMKDLGHTEILKRVTKTPEIFMTFLGKRFNVVLLTGHTSIKKAYDRITEERLETCLALTHKARAFLQSPKKAKAIAVVGCNPHAGEEGVIDSKESEIYKPVLSKMKKRKVQLTEPLVPDVCFQEKYWNQYSYYVASYHDQGLIPFKMAHGPISGVQVSLGLPFVRTSVDHGTAKDIFGKNKANEPSMKKAIEVAMNLVQKKSVKW